MTSKRWKAPLKQYEDYTGGQTPKTLAYVMATITLEPGFERPFVVAHFEALEVRLRELVSDGFGISMDEVSVAFEEYVEANDEVEFSEEEP